MADKKIDKKDKENEISSKNNDSTKDTPINKESKTNNHENTDSLSDDFQTPSVSSNLASANQNADLDAHLEADSSRVVHNAVSTAKAIEYMRKKNAQLNFRSEQKTSEANEQPKEDIDDSNSDYKETQEDHDENDFNRNLNNAGSDYQSSNNDEHHLEEERNSSNKSTNIIEKKKNSEISSDIPDLSKSTEENSETKSVDESQSNEIEENLNGISNELDRDILNSPNTSNETTRNGSTLKTENQLDEKKISNHEKEHERNFQNKNNGSNYFQNKNRNTKEPRGNRNLAEAKKAANVNRTGNQAMRKANALNQAKKAEQARKGSVVAKGAAKGTTKVATTVIGGKYKLIAVGIGALIGFMLLLTLCFQYALPTSQFEVLETYQEKYETELYAADNDVASFKAFVIGLKVGAEATIDIGKSLVEFVGDILNVTNKDHENQDIEKFTSNGEELKITQEEKAQINTLVKKIDATQEKINARCLYIRDAIFDKDQEITNAVEDHFNHGQYDEFTVNMTAQARPLSAEGAAAIMGLYMVQEDASIENIKMSSYMKWLGYYNSVQSEKLKFDVYGVPVKVQTWQGDFLPQYLHEQKKQEIEMYGKTKTDFEELQTAAVDTILVADIPELDELQVRESDIIDDEGKVIGKRGTVHININIEPRDLKEIADIQGFWIGDLTKRQEYMPSNLSVNMIGTTGTGSVMGSYDWEIGGDLPPWEPCHDLGTPFVGIPGQCTWWAAERMYQLNKVTHGEMGADLTGLYMGDGGQWSTNARKYGFEVSRTAKVGTVACFVPGQTCPHAGDAWAVNTNLEAACGHVAVVEQVFPDGRILVSEFWGSFVDYQVHASIFSAETASQIDYIDFSKRA